MESSQPNVPEVQPVMIPLLTLQVTDDMLHKMLHELLGFRRRPDRFADRLQHIAQVVVGHRGEVGRFWASPSAAQKDREKTFAQPGKPLIVRCVFLGLALIFLAVYFVFHDQPPSRSLDLNVHLATVYSLLHGHPALKCAGWKKRIDSGEVDIEVKG